MTLHIANGVPRHHALERWNENADVMRAIWCCVCGEHHAPKPASFCPSCDGRVREDPAFAAEAWRIRARENARLETLKTAGGKS